jgi:Amidohydrolase family
MAARVTAFVVFAIVAVTFVAGLIVGAQRADDSGPVDLIVYNAKVYTGDQKAPFAEAVAVRGNRILRVGSNRDIKRLMRRATTVIDAHGGSVTAGFHDGRVDLAAAGRAIALAKAAEQVAPPSAASSDSRTEGERAAERLDDLRTAMADANRVGLTSVEVTARTADELAPYDTLLRNRELTARINAALAVDWPLNDAALDQLEQTRRKYQRVPLFKVDAIRLTVSDGIDETGTHASVTGAAASRPAHAFGVTHATAMDSAPRVRMVPASMVTGATPDFAAMPATVPPIGTHPLRGSRAGRGGRVSARATAAAAAALEARTADLGQTITRLGSRGWQIILQTADAGDAALALNALESSRNASDANSASSASNGAGSTSGTSGASGASTASANKPATSTPKPRIRLELGAPVDEATAARFVRLGVIASLPQPASAESSLRTASTTVAPSSLQLDASASAAISSSASAMSSAATMSRDASTLAAAAPSLDRNASASTATAATAVRDTSVAAAPTSARDGIATASAAAADGAIAAPGEPKSWPYANLLDGTGAFVFHSGWPSTPLDPRFALSVVLLEGLLLTGADPATIEDAANLSARLTRALDAYTREAAFACADENQEGTIAKEMLADLVVFSTDLFTLPPDKLLDAEVTTTIFDGKVVYTRQPEPADATSSQ